MIFNPTINSLLITLNRLRSFNQTFIAIVKLLFYRVVSGLEDEGRNSDSSWSLLPKDRVMVLILAWKPRRAGHFVIGTAYESRGHLELFQDVSSLF